MMIFFYLLLAHLTIVCQIRKAFFQKYLVLGKFIEQILGPQNWFGPGSDQLVCAQRANRIDPSRDRTDVAIFVQGDVGRDNTTTIKTPRNINDYGVFIYACVSFVSQRSDFIYFLNW